MSEYKKLTVALVGPHDPSEFLEEHLREAQSIGAFLAKTGVIVATGAVSGFPMWGALGAFESGGTTIGFSPASSKYEHENHFRQPTDYLSTVVYTGFGYLGRDIVMARSVDIVVVFLGEEGSPHELLLTKELQKPLLVLAFDYPNDVVEAILGDILNQAEIYRTREDLEQRLVEILTN